MENMMEISIQTSECINFENSSKQIILNPKTKEEKWLTISIDQKRVDMFIV